MNKFDKAQRPAVAEEFGKNSHGCWSQTTGKWIPKEDEHMYDYADKGITYPGFLKPEVKDEKKERY